MPAPEAPTEGGGSPWGQLAVSAGTAAISAISKGGPKRQYKYNKKAMKDADKMNRANQIWALEQNKKLQAEQRQYDSTEAQMNRYRAAGLNPNLIYGNTPESPPMISVGNQPAVQANAPDASYPDVSASFTDAMLAQSQLGLNEAKTNKTVADTELVEIQQDIAKTNPMLKPDVAQSVSSAMEMTARAKRIEMELTWTRVPPGQDYSLGHSRIRADVEAMNQKLGLNTTDQKIKNAILEGKGYENAIKEIQKKWLEDGDITPEHIRQGLMMLLAKMAN